MKCSLCLSDAKFLCANCFKGKYCSCKCQQKDWHDGHYKLCGNPTESINVFKKKRGGKFRLTETEDVEDFLSKLKSGEYKLQSLEFLQDGTYQEQDCGNLEREISKLKKLGAGTYGTVSELSVNGLDLMVVKKATRHYNTPFEDEIAEVRMLEYERRKVFLPKYIPYKSIRSRAFLFWLGKMR